MAATGEEFADGRLNIQLNRVTEMELEKKCSKVGTIARFDWELGAMKHNILSSEDNTPKAHLCIFVQCNERLKRLDGWSCTAKIKFILESEKKTKTFSRENVRYPTNASSQQNLQLQQQSTTSAGNAAYLQIPWDQLEEEFQLNNDLGDDWLRISAQITVIEQFGYGTLIQLNVEKYMNIEMSSSEESSEDKENQMPSTTVTHKKRRFRPGQKALMEIRKFQRTVKPLLPRAPFSRLCKEIVVENAPNRADLRIQSEAISALQEASEAFLVTFFEAANRCAIHARRITVTPADLNLLRWILNAFGINWI